MMGESSESRTAEFRREVSLAVARLKAGVLALVFGLIAGVGLFVMTAVLVLDGGPNAGAHLGLLGQYFIGYTVTWKGAAIGFVWGFIAGGAVGWSIGTLYNRIVGIRR